MGLGIYPIVLPLFGVMVTAHGGTDPAATSPTWPAKSQRALPSAARFTW